jgi:ABC-type transporter Mla subunit MlaD
MRRFLLTLLGLWTFIPITVAQEASPGGSPPVGVEALAEAVEKNAAAISEQGKALGELREATTEISAASKDLTEAVNKSAAAIADQNKAVSDVREAIQDMSGTNKQVISDLREAVVALTAQAQRASADLVQAISKLAEAQRSSSDELREDVKWLRSEVRKIEPARRTIFVSYPSTVECGAGTNDCSTRATSLCTGLGFKTGSAAAYQTAPGDAKNPAKPAKFGSIGAVCSD